MSPTPIRRQYRVPTMRKIDRGPRTEELYRAEARSTEALNVAAKALEGVLTTAGLLPKPASHYQDVRPEAIFTMLESQDTRAALVACMGFVSWYRQERPETFRAALKDWTTQRGSGRCPICEGRM